MVSYAWFFEPVSMHFLCFHSCRPVFVCLSNAGFPAFFAWIRALPDCFGFNRLEHFLQLHAVPLKNVSCQLVNTIPGRILTTRTFALNEYVTFAKRLVGLDNTTSYLIDNSCFFSYHNPYVGHVKWQQEGYNGGIFAIDKVLQPTVNQLAFFPTKTIFQIMSNHSDLSIFYALLVHLNIDTYLRVDSATAQLYSTVFAPVNQAFIGFNMSYLFNPFNRNEVRRWVLGHFVAGQTYLYQCPIFRTNQVLGSTTLFMEGGNFLTFTGTNQALQIRYGRNNATGNSQAQTIPPWVDIEATDGLIHKINCFLAAPQTPAPSPAASIIPSTSATVTASLTLSATHTVSGTFSPSLSPTTTVSASTTPSYSSTVSSTLSATFTASRTASSTVSSTMSSSVSPTLSPSISASATATPSPSITQSPEREDDDDGDDNDDSTRRRVLFDSEKALSERFKDAIRAKNAEAAAMVREVKHSRSLEAQALEAQEYAARASAAEKTWRKWDSFASLTERVGIEHLEEEVAQARVLANNFPGADN
jgi:uncharacterized surface protein with fasciclin (FAS1) repeats